MVTLLQELSRYWSYHLQVQIFQLKLRYKTEKKNKEDSHPYEQEPTLGPGQAHEPAQGPSFAGSREMVPSLLRPTPFT